MDEVQAGLRRAVLQELKEELRTHGKYAGWHRLLLAIDRGAVSPLTVGRVADRLRKDYHGTYVQIGRFRDFVASWSRRNGHRLGATAEVVVHNHRGPTTVEIAVKPLVPEKGAIDLSESDGSLLHKILDSLQNALANDGGLSAAEYEALRKQAARLNEILDTAAWKARLRRRDGEG